MKTLASIAAICWLLVWSGSVGSVHGKWPIAPAAVSGLSGQLLVANRQLADPRFFQTVIYIIADSDEGSMGLIVNRKAGAIALKQILRGLGIRVRSDKREDVYYGGPVEVTRGFVLHTLDYTGASTQALSREIALSTGPDILKALAGGKGPKQSRFVLGYAGWGKGQLARELARTDWLVAPADPTLIFSSDAATVWERALKRAGIQL